MLCCSCICCSCYFNGYFVTCSPLPTLYSNLYFRVPESQRIRNIGIYILVRVLSFIRKLVVLHLKVDNHYVGIFVKILFNLFIIFILVIIPCK